MFYLYYAWFWPWKRTQNSQTVIYSKHKYTLKMPTLYFIRLKEENHLGVSGTLVLDLIKFFNESLIHPLVSL